MVHDGQCIRVEDCPSKIQNVQFGVVIAIVVVVEIVVVRVIMIMIIMMMMNIMCIYKVHNAVVTKCSMC